MFETFDSLLIRATSSDFFLGGLALGLLGAAVALLGTLWRLTSAFVARRVWVRVTLDNRTSAYRHLALWLEHTGVLAHVRQVRMSDGQWAAGTSGHAPAPGRHWFRHGGRLCRYARHLDVKARVGGQRGQRPMETLEVAVLFGRIGTVLGWIAEGARLAAEKDRQSPMLYVLRGDWWDDVGRVPRRAIGTVTLEDGAAEQVLADMRRFYGAADWYAARGVPWRRGYLLHGPPGTGKSSLIRALASELELDVATLDLGRSTLSDDDLREAMGRAPRSALIAMEDVDAVFTRREAGAAQAGVSFSGLLNAIDGIAAQEGRALVMTTNHPDRLDPALIRPGRADLHVRLDLVGATAAERFFLRFFPGEAVLAARFARALGGARFVPAAIQGWLLQCRDDPEAAAEATGLTIQSPPLAAE